MNPLWSSLSDHRIVVYQRDTHTDIFCVGQMKVSDLRDVPLCELLHTNIVEAIVFLQGKNSLKNVRIFPFSYPILLWCVIFSECKTPTPNFCD